MENSFTHHRDNQRAKRASAGRTYRPCPCCRDDLPTPLRSSKNVSCKRKREEEVGPSLPPAEPLSVSPSSCQPSNSDVDPSRPSSTTEPDGPQVLSDVLFSAQPSTSALQDDGSLSIHKHSVEEYQKIYKEVVEGMLRFKNGTLRPYTLALGRRIKQRLWEKMNKPTITTTTSEDGLVSVNMSYGTGVHPPLHNMDVSDEPKPRKRRTEAGQNRVKGGPRGT